jgi:8-oxo-dGTP pyrophosphatase MutT (NUDIX family)
MMDDGETPAQAAARELYEETGLVIDHSELIDLGRSEYTREKDYHLFLYRANYEVSENQHLLICESKFISRDGTLVEEIDQYLVTSLKTAVKLLNKKQSVIVEAAIKKI